MRVKTPAANAPDGIAIKNANTQATKMTNHDGALPTSAANSLNVPRKPTMLMKPKNRPTPKSVVKMYLEPSIKFSLTLSGDTLQKITQRIAAINTLMNGKKNGTGNN